MLKKHLFSKNELALLGILAAVQFSHIVDFVIMMPLGPQLMRIFSINPQQFSWLVSSYTLTAGVSGFAASFFLDRFDRKKSLLFFYFGFASGTFACALAPNFGFLLIARSLAGAFGGVLGSLVFSIVSDQISYDRRGTAMGILMGSFSLASIFGVPFGLYLATQITWHAPFVFLAGLSLTIWVFVFFALPSMTAHLKGEGSRHKAFESILHIFNTPSQWKALVFMFCLVMGHFSIIPFVSPSFVANAGLSEENLPLVYLFGGMASFFATPLVGRLADRFGKHLVFRISAIVSIPAILIVTHLGVVSTPVLLAIVCFFFVAIGGRMVPSMALVSATASPQYRASFMSITSSVQQLSSALAALLSGAIVARVESGRLVNYGQVGWMAIAFTMVAFFLSGQIKNIESKS